MRRLRPRSLLSGNLVLVLVFSLSFARSEKTNAGRTVQSLQRAKNIQANSPKLNLFLQNVLQAQDELKWIDQAVRSVGAKESGERSTRSLRAPLRSLKSTASRYRRSDSETGYEKSWPSSDKSYYDDREKSGTLYPRDSYRRSLREMRRSNLEDRPAVDDLTLKHWAQEEGLEVPGSWFETDEGVDQGQWSRSVLEDRGREGLAGNVDDWREKARDEREVVGNSDSGTGEGPTLESLKKTVLELRKSLQDGDNKMDEFSERDDNFGQAKNRERHVEDVSGRKEGRAKGEHERNVRGFRNTENTGNFINRNSNFDPGSNGYEEIYRDDLRHSFDPSSSNVEVSSGSNWWDDPRSAEEAFDFKRREDEADDDDEDDEDSQFVNSEFDDMMRRVKREKDEEKEGETRVRVYHRAGFGESYPEENEYERKKRNRQEDREPETGIITGNESGRIREIREAVPDKINNEQSSATSESAFRKSFRANVSDNDHPAVEGASPQSGPAKIAGDDESGGDNPVEKSSQLPGDALRENLQKDGNLDDNDEKRSPNHQNRDNEERRQGFSGVEIPVELSAMEIEKARLDELLKSAPMEPLAEAIARENEAQTENTKRSDAQDTREHVDQVKKEVEKSEPTDDEVHRLSEELNAKKDDRRNQQIDSRDKTTTDQLQSLEDGEEPVEVFPMIVDENLEAKSDAKVADDERDVKLKTGDTVEGERKLGAKVCEESKTVKVDGSELDAKLRALVEAGDARSKTEKLVKEEGDRKELKQEFKYEEPSSAREEIKIDDRSNEHHEESVEENGKNPENTKSLRKLLWLDEEDDLEIRDGRRDSTWDQRDGEKTGQQPTNHAKNSVQSPNEAFERSKKGVKFVRRSLMVANDNEVEESSRIQKRHSGVVNFDSKSRQGARRSVKSYPEENVAEDVRRSDSRKRSVGNTVDIHQSEPDLDEDTYELEDEDSNTNSEGEESPEMESEVLRSTGNQERDRDPMRDRINMLIKQKLDDRSKGKLQVQFKREATFPVKNIEYYDYDNDVNAEESDADSGSSDFDHRTQQRNNNSTNVGGGEIAIDRAPPSMMLKDKSGEAERKQEEEQDKLKPPKQEFISDVDLANAEKQTLPPGEPRREEKPFEEDRRRINESEVRNVLKEAESSNELHDRRETQVTKSNDRWLGEPVEAYPEVQVSKDVPEDREANGDNGKSDVLGESLEYSVNVRGKIDPGTIGAILGEKVTDAKDSDKFSTFDASSRYDDRKRNEAEDRLTETDEDLKYRELRDKSRSSGEQRIDNEEVEGDRAPQHLPYGERASRADWRYGDSDRIEEGNNAAASSQNYFPRNSDKRDKIHEDQRLGDRTGAELEEEELEEGENVSGEEIGLVEEPFEDSLPTMLDRSGPRSLAPGERTYLVIAPASGSRYPCKPNGDEGSSSSGSNYMALKVTDDMFKGGIEQSNPAEEKLMDPNAVGITTTEWKVIKMDDAETKTFNYSGSRDSEIRLREVSLDPRDAVHESFVDPEEMGAADFDDDMIRLRLGRDLKYVRESNDALVSATESQGHLSRSLQSVSFPIDPFEGVYRNKEDMDVGERAVEKYLENTREHFLNEETASQHSVGKRSVATFVNKESRDETSKSDEETSVKKSVEQQKLVSNVAPDLSKKKGDDVQKRSSEEKTESSRSEDNQTDKDKHGLTNVEEWQMDTPTIEKQHLVEDTSKTTHERQSRSVRFRDDSTSDKRRSKVTGKMKTNPFAEYATRFRSNYESGRGNGWHGDWRDRDDDPLRKSDDDEARAWREPLKQRHDDHRSFSSSRNRLREYAEERTPRDRHSEKSRKNTPTEYKEVHPPSRLMLNEKRHDKPITYSQHIQAAKSYDSGFAEKKVMDESPGDPGQNIRTDNERHKKKFTALLAADNMEDDSQMDLALHGELAGKIVEKIFDQVQENNALKIALGPGLYRKHKSEDAVATDKIYRQGLDEDEVKHTEGMMRRVMELLGRLILDEVQRKTCVSLPPDMQEFLQWMLGVEDDGRDSEQVNVVPPLPLIHDQDTDHHQEDKFLFDEATSGHDENGNVDELNKKIRLLKSLIDEYNSLSSREKTKVQTVHDYLVRQLGLLVKYIEAKQGNQGSEFQGKRVGGENILQYQNAVPNGNGTSRDDSTLSPLVNTPSILMLSNASFNVQPPIKPSPSHIRARRRGIRRSIRAAKKKHKKRKHKNHNGPHSRGHNGHKNKKKKKKTKKKKHRQRRGEESPAYAKLIRRAAMLRKKRANIYEDEWDPMDSGYEKPVIYSSTGELTNGETKKKRSFVNEEDEEDEDTEIGKDFTSLGGKMVERSDDTVALQPWLNSKPDNAVSSEYLNALSSQLVHGSLHGQIDEEEVGKREVEMKDDVVGVAPLGRRLADDEAALLSKRENERQLEEVAFGKDMRGKWREKEQFRKLTEMDRKKITDDGALRMKREGDDEEDRSMVKVIPSERSEDEITTEDNKISDLTVKNNENRVGEVTGLKKREENATEAEEPSNKVQTTPGFVATGGDSEIPKGSKGISVSRTKNEAQEGLGEPERTSLQGNLASLDADAVNEMSRKVNDSNSEYETSNRQEKNDTGTTNTGTKQRRDELGQTRQRSEVLKNSSLILTWDKTSGNRKDRKRASMIVPEVEESAILPLLDVSEQREQRKQAAKTEKDDQRDIADQTLG